MQLREFRNIDFSVVFEARLMIDMRFGYSIAYLFEFGLFMKGNILRAEVGFVVENNGVIPYQLVTAIMDVPEISRENRISTVFAIDLALYAA